MEHLLPINVMFRNLVLSGAAFGAHRWLGALQRACDRYASLAALGVQHHDPSGGTHFVFPHPILSNPCTYDANNLLCFNDADAVTPEGKRSMMKLSQRMVSSFCAGVTSSPTQRWTFLAGNSDVSVRVFTHRAGELGQPSGVVLAASTSIWLPVPVDHVFALVRDVSARSQVRPGVVASPSPFIGSTALMCVFWVAVGRPDARQSGAGGVAHHQRHQSRQLHLPAEGERPCLPRQIQSINCSSYPN